jgi:hypothetical protein
MSCVFSGIGVLALVSGHVEARWTRYGHTAPLEGAAAHAFGLSIFFFGLLPLMLAASSPRVAKWIGCISAALGLLSVFGGLLFAR